MSGWRYWICTVLRVRLDQYVNRKIKIKYVSSVPTVYHGLVALPFVLEVLLLV